jgi:hypothetical protein
MVLNIKKLILLCVENKSKPNFSLHVGGTINKTKHSAAAFV